MTTIFTEWQIAAKDQWKMSVLENFKFFTGSPSKPQHEDIFIVKDDFIRLVFHFVAENNSPRLTVFRYEE